MRHRPGPCPLAFLLLTTLIVSCASAGSDLPDSSTSLESEWPALPNSFEMEVDEPVFGETAWILEAGRGKETNIVLVHGLGEDASLSWSPIVPELARDHHVVVFDLPGFGRSTRANELYNPDNYVAFIDFVVSRYIDGRFVLVGHSMGGAIALRYAGDHPDRVERLVLVDAAGILHRTAYTNALAQLGIERLPDSYPGRGLLSRWVGGLFSSTAGMMQATDPAEQWILASPEMRQRFLGGDPNKIAGLALLLEDFSRPISRVRAPTLVVWGEGDSIAPLRTGKVLAGNIPAARLKVIPGGGHTPMRTEPRRLLRILREFLSTPRDDLIAGGTPYALDPAIDPRSDRVGRCDDNRHRQVFEGEFDRIVVRECREVVLKGVRAREVRIIDSRVGIENSVIRSDGTALGIVDSPVKITASRIEGRTAVAVEEGRLDIAGSVLIGERAAIEVGAESTSDDPDEVRVLFSVSRVESPKTSGYVHGPRTVSHRRPL